MGGDFSSADSYLLRRRDINLGSRSANRGYWNSFDLVADPSIAESFCHDWYLRTVCLRGVRIFAIRPIRRERHAFSA